MTGPKTLMVTPYAPYRDGIAAYAVQEVRRLRADGVDLDVASPLPSAADHHLALGGVRGMAALVKRAARYDAVIIQFSPEMLFGACRHPGQRIAVWAGLVALATRTSLEIRLHEIEYGPIDRNPAERAIAAKALQAADRVTVHTAREVDELVERLGLARDDVTLVDHGATFVAATAAGRDEARADLGLDPDEHVFLAIGFLQEHKGYDRAVDAFARAHIDDHASLHVVGSVRVDHPDLLDYARRLAARCRATPGVTLHQAYVSDEAFDRWIVAADTIVLPYREIWSSGVLERAKLYDRAVIATDVGGMADQAPAGTRFFTDTETFVQALKERALATGSTSRARPADAEPGPGWDVGDGRPDRARIEEQIRGRVRRARLAETADEPTAAPTSAIDPLLAIGPLVRPHAVSARPGVTTVKRAIRRVLGWELDPIVDRLDELQRATVEAVAALDRRIDRGPDEDGDS